jgi:hypothetical protein
VTHDTADELEYWLDHTEVKTIRRIGRPRRFSLLFGDEEEFLREVVDELRRKRD